MVPKILLGLGIVSSVLYVVTDLRAQKTREYPSRQPILVREAHRGVGPRLHSIFPMNFGE